MAEELDFQKVCSGSSVENMQSYCALFCRYCLRPIQNQQFMNKCGHYRCSKCKMFEGSECTFCTQRVKAASRKRDQEKEDDEYVKKLLAEDKKTQKQIDKDFRIAKNLNKKQKSHG
ncbi:MAG: hypothetical protein P4M11_13420 [Candidatus Pacebacteria bacterium]|nr:hypothetical protein [Candidatus Paceibacterota bacterium]